jgi:hypothetical protein
MPPRQPVPGGASLCGLVAAALGVLVVRHGAVLGIAVELAVAVLVVDEGRVEEEGEEDDAIMVEKGGMVSNVTFQYA